MAFSASFLDEIRTRVSLVGIIGRRVKLTRKGREYAGLCPFHNEKTPSFWINEDKGFYHCFGCGAHGDVISFEMHSQSLSFPEAVERLAQEAGLEVPRQAPEEREKARREASLHDVLEAACAFFAAELRAPGGRRGLDYLSGRGLDEATIARFRLGYAPDSRLALKTALKAAGISEALAVEAGLLILPEGGGDSYDRFRGRVMFPITDRRGRVIAFGGRILGDGQPKYLNSPDTPLFHKGTVLYGLAQAREAAARAGTVIVCEGYMDVIALHRAGFAHAVAPLGTALTEQQIALLWKMAPEPVLCLDGDAAGQRAAAKAAGRALPLLKPGLSLRFATVPAPEDPDSLIRARGPQAMAEVLARAEPLSEVLWRVTLAEHAVDTPERRAALEQALMGLAQDIADPTVQQQYRGFFRDRLRAHLRPPRPIFTPGAFPSGPRPLRPWNGGGGKAPARPSAYGRGADGRLPGAGLPPRPTPAWLTQERLLLLTVIHHPGLLEEVGERLGSLSFTDSALDKLRQEVLKHLGSRGRLDSEGLQGHLRLCGFSQILDGLLEACAGAPAMFSLPDAPPDKAREGWEHTFTMYLRRELAADLLQAEQDAARDLTPDQVDRLAAFALTRGREDGGDG